MVKQTDCEIIDYSISLTRIVDEDGRIKDDSVKISALSAFSIGLDAIISFPNIKKLPGLDIIKSLNDKIGVIFLGIDEKTMKDLVPTEKWRLFKEYLNEEHKKNCHPQLPSINHQLISGNINITESDEGIDAYFEILRGFSNFIEHTSYWEIDDNTQLLLIDYFDYGLSTMFLLPDIDKIQGFDIYKIDNLRKNIHEIIHAGGNSTEIYNNFVEYLTKEFDENYRPNIESKDIKSASIKGFIFTKQLIEKMRNSVIDSNNKNQIIQFNLCAKENIVSGKVLCEDGDIPIGYFRAIPEIKYPEPTTDDIKLGLKLGMICLGGINEIYCAARKGEYNEDAYNEIQEIINKSDKLKEMGEKIRQKKSEFLDKDIKSGNLEVIDIPLEVEELKRALDLEHLPGLQLGKYILPIDVIQEMKDTIIEGKMEVREIAFDLCAGNDNIIKTKNKFRWEETYVMTSGQCAKGDTFVGTFHTHSPYRKVDISLADLLGTYENIQCIGAMEEIKCFLRHNFNGNDKNYLEKLRESSTHHEFIKLGNERSDFVEKYFEDITLL